MDEKNDTKNTSNNIVVGDETGVNSVPNAPYQPTTPIETKGGRNSLGDSQKMLTAIMVGTGLLLGILLTALQLSSPTGNIGDEGIIGIPLLLILVPITPIAFLISLLHLLIRRPTGKSLAITLLGILFPLAMIGSMFGYGSFQHRQGLIDTDLAISLVQQCKVKEMGGGTNHKRWEIIMAEPTGKKVYINSKDSKIVSRELQNAKAKCN